MFKLNVQFFEIFIIEIFPIKYHHFCRINNTLLCFYDAQYLCICSEQNVRAECFGYDHYLDQCWRCLAGGRCLQENRLQTQNFVCLCPRCHRGSLCQFNTEIQSFSLDSLFSQIGFNIELLYMILVILIFIIDGVNNYASFVTFKRPKSRQFGVGTYLLLMSIMNQCSLFALLGKTMQILFGSLLNNISCKILSYMLSVFTRCSFWLTSWVTIDRLLVLFFSTSLILKKPSVSISMSVTTLLCFFAIHLHAIIYSTIAQHVSTDLLICVVNINNHLISF